MSTSSQPALALDDLRNFRDLGGLRLEAGGHTLGGRLLRSDVPVTVGEETLQRLLDLGIGTVVDLRTVSEREQHPSRLVGPDRVREVHAPIFDDGDAFPPDLVTSFDVYSWWLRDRAPGLAAALTGIADSPTAPVLVHCHAGKDRTGVVVAIVLRLAGVGIADVADDYGLSGVQLADMLQRDRRRAVGEGMDETTAERLFTVNREQMVATLSHIDVEYGGVVALARRLGLDADRIQRLGDLLTAPTWP